MDPARPEPGGSPAAAHEQVIDLGGGPAGRMAAVGVLIAVVGSALAWMVRAEPWPMVVGSSLVDGPTIALGLFMLALADVTSLEWIEGDSDIAGGVRLHTRSGGGLFVPAESFDVKSFWAFAMQRPASQRWPARGSPPSSPQPLPPSSTPP